MNLKQAIPLTSIHNARELGGYRTADGKTVKSGLLLRTGNLNGISAEDRRTLTERYRLQDLVDFRMAMEMQGADEPIIDGAAYHHLNVIDPAAFGGEDMAAVDLNKLDLIQLTQFTVESGMLGEGMYIGFLAGEPGKKAYAEFFRILLAAEPDRAVLWHCTSGKDRTGLAAMLLLSALGVEEERIIEDYLLTNVFNARRIAATRQYLEAQGCGEDFIRQAVLVFDAVDESFMRKAIGFLKQEYGSVPGYIRAGLGISQTEIDALRAKYLV